MTFSSRNDYADRADLEKNGKSLRLCCPTSYSRTEQCEMQFPRLWFQARMILLVVHQPRQLLLQDSKVTL